MREQGENRTIRRNEELERLVRQIGFTEKEAPWHGTWSNLQKRIPDNGNWIGSALASKLLFTFGGFLWPFVSNNTHLIGENAPSCQGSNLIGRIQPADVF